MILLLLAFGLSGCAVAETFGLDEMVPKKDPIYDKPIDNLADRREPFSQRMRFPMPDDAWTRESASEYEPWTKR